MMILMICRLSGMSWANPGGGLSVFFPIASSLAATFNLGLCQGGNASTSRDFFCFMSLMENCGSFRASTLEILPQR